MNGARIPHCSEAAAVAQALGGRRVGDGWLCPCPLPWHGRRRGDINPSLKVADGRTRLIVHCHAGCETHEVLAALRSRVILDDGRNRPSNEARPSANDNENALAIWNAGTSPANSPVALYLQNRGILIPIPSSIRFTTGLDQRPAMIVAVQSLAGDVQAIQFTYLSQDGRKADGPLPRRTVGSMIDGAARLGKAGPTLGLAEGTEDALAVMQLHGIACWASLGAGRMYHVAVPKEVRQIHVFADNDDAGKAAAERTATVHNGQGRTVVLRYAPSDHKDWASVVENQKKRSAA